MMSDRPVKTPKRKVSRRPAGLIELSLGQAAINCGTSEVTLKRKLGVHRIQPNQNGCYLIADLLSAFGPNGDSPGERSLESRALLQGNKARLTELEILEKEKVLVRKEPVMKFLGGMVQTVYRTIETFGLDREQLANVCHAVESAAEAYCLAEGHPLLTLAEAREARARFPHLLNEWELWARLNCERYYGQQPTKDSEVAAAG